MKTFLLLATCLASSALVAQQIGDFPYGNVTLQDLKMTSYARDTSANGVYLAEFGHSYFDPDDDNNLIFYYHGVIKILRSKGLEEADFGIRLHHDGQYFEQLANVQGTTYNLVDGQIVQTPLELKDIFTQKLSDHTDRKTFTMPDVRPGSVIEVTFTVKAPFVFSYNFRGWTFQADIPKVYSEYWATIPPFMEYNISVKGFLKLDKNEQSIVKRCNLMGSEPVDCSRFDLAMSDIPAFVEEKNMTAPSNFISTVNFELSAQHLLGGAVKRFTETWKDVENDLNRSSDFGQQLRRGKDLGDAITDLVRGHKDTLERANLVFEFIKKNFKWDGVDGFYSQNGIKKAFSDGEGNVGDINLSLVAALRFAGVNAQPMLLSTRENGLPTDLHPVLSDFNYVIAIFSYKRHNYLLDATDHDIGFGMIPVRCLNGRGRVFTDDGSYWYNLWPPVDAREIYVLALQMTPDGNFKGTISSRLQGYAAYDKRKEIESFSGRSDYAKHLASALPGGVVTNDSVQNVDDPDQPILESYDVEFNGPGDLTLPTTVFNPFLVDRLTDNPYKLQQRLYPVDLGRPQEETINVQLDLPENFQPANLPDGINIALPGGTAQFVCNAKMIGNKLNLTYSLALKKSVYTSDEYQGLKEFYSRIVQLEGTDIILKKTSN